MTFHRIAPILLPFVVLTQLIHGQPTQVPNQSVSQVDTLLQGQGAAFVNEVPFAALSVGIINQGTTRFYNLGTTQPGRQQFPTLTTLYEIGSITKTFTGTLLARAATDGRIKLDDDIRQYMVGSYPNLDYHGQPIRLVYLLNHSSGLPFGLIAYWAGWLCFSAQVGIYMGLSQFAAAVSIHNGGSPNVATVTVTGEFRHPVRFYVHSMYGRKDSV